MLEHLVKGMRVALGKTVHTHQQAAAAVLVKLVETDLQT
jgi:hypothetical protein